MNELELFKELIENKRIAHDLQIRINIWTNEAERERFVQEHERINEEIDRLENQLIEIEDKKYSREARASIIDQLTHYITEINKASPSLNLSRSQGLMMDNELFASIIRDVNYLVIDKVFGLRIPAYLVYTTEPEDSVSIPKLTEFLTNEITILRHLDTINYPVLWQYKDQLIDRIRGQFIE